MQETQFNSWVGKICWRRDRLPIPVFLGFPCGSADKESACNAGDLGLIPGLRRSPGEGKGYLLQYSGLGNSVDCIVHGVVQSWTWLSDFHLLTHSFLIITWNPIDTPFLLRNLFAEESVEWMNIMNYIKLKKNVNWKHLLSDGVTRI